jgi:acetoin utilization deacetylase AcuC-like enzyme
MNLHIYHHAACQAHNPGPDHSERSERLTGILRDIHAVTAPETRWIEMPAATRESIERVHTPAYVEYVFNAVPSEGFREIEVNEIVSEDDGGEVTTLSPESGEAVLRATGGVCAAVDALMSGATTRAFCATRPPGHHALADKAMGFCVFNNVAIAARHAQAVHGARRVAIVDFDVHHGNGTQAIFEADPTVFFASIHQLPLWPETGHAHETGVGNILNVPVAPNLTRLEWLQIWREKVIARLAQESFDLLIVSAGFDAHADDPKGSQNLQTEDYATLMQDLIHVANSNCQGRIMAVLEGGYDLNASAASAAAVVSAMQQ